MTVRATVLTQWTGTGNDPDDGVGVDYFRPKILNDHPGISLFSDITSQAILELPTDPNLYVIAIECPESVLDDISGDPNYYILTSEVINEAPQ